MGSSFFRSGRHLAAAAIQPPEARAGHEAALLARIHAGEERAFDEVFTIYYAALSQFALTFVPTPEAAEDVVHEALMQVWRSRAHFVVRGSLRSYLFGAVRHRALDWVRRDRTARRQVERWEREDGHEVPGLAVSGDSVDRRMERDEARAAVRRAVARLPERARTAVVLRWEHGWSYAEIAEAVGSNAKAVEMQLYRALQRLRAALRDWM